MKKQRKKSWLESALDGDTKSLLEFPSGDDTQEDRLLRVCMLAYLKHTTYLDADEIGWDFLTDILYYEIVNSIGDDEFVRWGKNLK